MPVVFVIDPKLPKDVKTITLSYTFFELNTPAAPPRRGKPRAGRGETGCMTTETGR
jgi:cytochrome c oxidase assembly protein subunit 11